MYGRISHSVGNNYYDNNSRVEPMFSFKSQIMGGGDGIWNKEKETLSEMIVR